MKKAIVYIHGQGGNAEEACHYRQIFPDYDVIGFDYKSQNPWDASKEFSIYFEGLRNRYTSFRIIANSIGAYFPIKSSRPSAHAI